VIDQTEKRSKTMKRIIPGMLAIGLLVSAASSVLAQSAPPAGPQDCKAGEQWDAATKKCIKS
jgi:hypothetical protein